LTTKARYEVIAGIVVILNGCLAGGIGKLLCPIAWELPMLRPFSIAFCRRNHLVGMIGQHFARATSAER